MIPARKPPENNGIVSVPIRSHSSACMEVRVALRCERDTTPESRHKAAPPRGKQMKTAVWVHRKGGLGKIPKSLLGMSVRFSSRPFAVQSTGYDSAWLWFHWRDLAAAKPLISARLSTQKIDEANFMVWREVTVSSRLLRVRCRRGTPDRSVPGPKPRVPP